MVLLDSDDRLNYVRCLQDPMKRVIAASVLEYEAALFGACFLSLGAGVLFASLIGKLAVPFILLGLLLHGWGMYSIHVRRSDSPATTGTPDEDR